MNEHYDVIVIGAGHNGLVCASRLAKAGRRVLALECSPEVGGACITRTFAPGFSVSAGAHLSTMLPKFLVEELCLPRHGLRFAAPSLATVALDGRGGQLRLDGSHLFGSALSDRQAWADFFEETGRFARVLAGALQKPAPRLLNGSLREKLSLAALGWNMRKLGRASMRELMRIGLMNIYDLVNEHFENDLLRAAVAFDAVLGTAMGPRSPNTVMTYLYRRAGEALGSAQAALPAGGMGAITKALAAEAGARGVTIRTGTRVARIIAEGERVTGVALANGEQISAARVISNADPRTTMRELIGYRNLDTGFVRRIEGIRMRGTAAKLHLALDGLPDFPGLDNDTLGQRLVLCGGLDAVERAFNPSKYGEFSPEPVLEFCIPSLHDPALAPPGRHVLSAVVQYAPYKLRSGWDEGRAVFEQRILAQLERVAPKIRAHIVASELLTPADLEREFGMSGGHWHHGEIAVDQLLMLRPVPLAARYAMPLEGLFLCGAGTHPGGSVNGLAGYHCASEILRQEKSS